MRDRYGHDDSQRAQEVAMTSYRRRCDVITSHRRQFNVFMTSCACWVMKLQENDTVVIAFFFFLLLTTASLPISPPSSLFTSPAPLDKLAHKSKGINSVMLISGRSNSLLTSLFVVFVSYHDYDNLVYPRGT